MSSIDGLERMKALLRKFGNPELRFRAIHIAGTNGKGSTAVMTASILMEAGYRVGLYTSPHLESECERIQLCDSVSGSRCIEQTELDKLRDDVLCMGKSLESTYGKLTVFEVYTAVAYLFFAESNVDFVVLETGLGGRLDSTNTLTKPLVTVITQVGIDHTAQLGDSIEQIAFEKAGIIKEGVPVVSQTDDEAVKRVIKKAADDHNSAFVDVNDYITGSENSASYGAICVPKLLMHGEHQVLNAATAVLAVRAAGIKADRDAEKRGLANARICGRFEILRRSHGDPKEGSQIWIIDGAHNPNAISTLTRTFNEFKNKNNIKRSFVIFGCMQDKNSAHMVQLLTRDLRDCSYAAVAVDYGRAEEAGRIGELISAAGEECKVFDSVGDAYSYAIGSEYQCILVTGSIYLAGAVRSLYFSQNS